MNKIQLSLPAFILAVFFLAALSVISPANSFAATTFVVDVDGQGTAANCNAAGAAFTTIQAAINAAVSGDTIKVCPGTYNETQVWVTKALSVLGSGADVTFINGGGNNPPNGGLVRLESPLGDTGNTLFSGFTVTNPGTANGTKAAVFAKPLDPASTVTISNNKIVGVNLGDYGFYSNRAQGAIVFSFNEITNTAFNPILLEQMINTTDVHHNTISGQGATAYFNFTYAASDTLAMQRVADNTINASTSSAITFNGAFQGDTGKFTNVQIINNVITQLQGAANRSGITLANTASAANAAGGVIANAVVTGNSINGTDFAATNGLRIRGLVTNALITCNTITNVDRSFSGEIANTHSATGTQLHNNNFFSNVTGFVWSGPALVDAENNWWGSATGPTNAGNPGGTGEPVSGNVDFLPFLTSPSGCSPGSDIAITKVDGPDPVIPGNNIGYTINVTNNGPLTATALTLTDTVPTNTTFQSLIAPAGWACTTPAVGGTGAVNCTAATLASGATASFALVVNVNSNTATGTVITNTATTSTTSADTNLANNSATATTTVTEFTSPPPTGLPTKALLVKPAAGNTTAGGGVSDSSCVAPTGVTVTGVFANINQALGAAAVGDTIYVCPKYTAGAVVPYIEQVSLGFTNLSVVGISDVRGSRAVIAANPSTATSSTTQIGTNYIVQIVATGVNFGNFVVDGAPAGTNFAGTGIFNGIAVRRSGAFVFNNTVQNIRTLDAAANANGQGIAVFGAGTAGSPLEAGTIANPVNILNNVVQNYRSNGVNISAGGSSAYAFVRGNYIIGSGAAGGTINQTGVQFQAGANGDVFNNRITRILDNVGGCSAAAFNNCSAGIRLNTTASSSINNLRVRYNQISNTQTGIFAQDVQYVSMTNNTISHSVIDGINLRGSLFNLGSNFNTINQNTIFAARRSGVFIGLVGGDASLGNSLTQNTIEDAFTGVANTPPAGNNTIPVTGATANTFISVNNFVGSATSGVNDVQNTNPLP